MTRFPRLVVIGALLSLALADGWLAGAASASESPSVAVSRGSARPGESVVVTFRGWQSRFVTISVCGNQAARGSVDCDLVGSQGVPMSRQSGPTLTDFVITTPPTTCPCVIRASNSTQTEIAFTPIVVVGVPMGPVVGPAKQRPLEVSMKARRAHQGIGAALRSSLGGPTEYDVTVTVRNRSAESVAGVRLYGWAGRSATDQSRTLDFRDPGTIGAGQSWSDVVRVRAPAPRLGRFYWEASVSGAGPAVRAESVTRDVPFLLLLIVLVVAGDLAAILGRRIMRGRTHASVAMSAPPVPAQTTVTLTTS